LHQEKVAQNVAIFGPFCFFKKSHFFHNFECKGQMGATEVLNKICQPFQTKKYSFLVKRVPGRGPELREPIKAVLCLLIIIILISY
jgi:hypothetical protein